MTRHHGLTVEAIGLLSVVPSAGGSSVHHVLNEQCCTLKWILTGASLHDTEASQSTKTVLQVLRVLQALQARTVQQALPGWLGLQVLQEWLGLRVLPEWRA